MAIEPDSSPYGSQTVTGPGFPQVDEEQLAAAAAKFEALAAKITGTIVPQQQSQLMSLSDSWQGGGALAATGEATTIIGGHEANGAQAAAIAAKLRAMEATVVKTKLLANATAVEVQRECEALSMMPFSNAQELVQSRIKMGLSQNIAFVNANTTELANTLAVPPSIPVAGTGGNQGQDEAKDAAETAQQSGGQGMQQMMQIASQMGGMAAQLPQQLGQMVTQVPQQLAQTVAQPLQQLTSMFGKGGRADALGAAGQPFSSFSKHPAAGGGGAGGGSGMVKAASTPGSGGSSPQTPLMAALVGTTPVSTAPAEVSAATATGGLAPVAAASGMGGGGMGPMMGGGQRGTSGGTAASLAVPPPLEYDLGEEYDDDEW